MRLIDADVLKQDLSRFYDGIITARELIDRQPTVELPKEQQPKKGEWVIDEYNIHHCQFCHAVNETVYRSFCPNCGADMRGEQE